MSRSTRSRWPGRFPSRVLLVGATLLALPAAAQTQSCIDVQVGSARSYDCINRALKQKVQAAQPLPDQSITTATAAPNRTGTFNQAATREFLGSSFGHSAVPQPHLHTVGPAAPP